MWPRLDPGQPRAGASAGSPAQSGPAAGGDVGSIDQTGAPPPLPVRPRWGPWAGGAAAAGPAIGREGRVGWPGSREPRRRGRRGAEPAGARSSPACSARPCPPHGNFPAAELVAQNPETRSLGDYATLALSCPTPLP